MKKISLFFSVIGVTFLMTSCLGEGSNSYTDSTFVYLAADDTGTPYGKTFSRYYSPARLITNPTMMTMDPGTFKVMSYGWEEANGVTSLLVDGKTEQADNVRLLEVVDIARTVLNMTELPEQPEQEDPAPSAGFDEIVAPLYAHHSNFMNDHWVIEYACTAKKGQKASVTFHKKKEKNEKGEIVIDVRLTLTGTPEGDSDVKYVNAVALNMSPLRAASSGEDKLEIRFKYYSRNENNNRLEEVESQNAYPWNISGNE